MSRAQQAQVSMLLLACLLTVGLMTDTGSGRARTPCWFAAEAGPADAGLITDSDSEQAVS
jgi:hypothetical protein